jgi:hypothetical protein
MITKASSFSPIRDLVTAAALLAACATAVTSAEVQRPVANAESSSPQPTYLTISKRGDMCVVTGQEPENVLFSSDDPRQAIEWALNHSRIAILTGGEFSISDGVKIPRSGVTLIIAQNATLQAAADAQLTAVSEGHGDYRPLIHNQGRDHVTVINFGTLRAGRSGGACIMFNGRSGGGLGINGGVVFSSGTLTQCGDAIWLVDSKNVQIPFAGDKSYGNNLMAIEGCEDLQIDTVAGLAGSQAGENETIDLNSYSRRIHVSRMIGTSRSEQVLDVNNSTDVVVDEIVGFTDGDEFRDQLVSIIHYGPQGRRLTQRPRIPRSENVQIHKKHVAKTRVSDWKIVTEVESLPESLPEMRVTVRVIGNPQKEPVIVFSRTYQFHLRDAPTVTVVE